MLSFEALAISVWQQGHTPKGPRSCIIYKDESIGVVLWSDHPPLTIRSPRENNHLRDKRHGWAILCSKVYLVQESRPENSSVEFSDCLLAPGAQWGSSGGETNIMGPLCLFVFVSVCLSLSLYARKRDCLLSISCYAGLLLLVQAWLSFFAKHSSNCVINTYKYYSESVLLLLLTLFHCTDRKIEARETKQPTELINRVLWLMCYSKQSSDLEKGKRFSWIGLEVTGQGCLHSLGLWRTQAFAKMTVRLTQPTCLC